MNARMPTTGDTHPTKHRRVLAVLAALMAASWLAAGCSDDSLVVGSLTTPDALLDAQSGDLLGSNADTAPQPPDIVQDVGAEDAAVADTGAPDAAANDIGVDDVDDGAAIDAIDAIDDAGPVTPTCPDCPSGYVCRLEGGPPRCVADPALSCAACALDLSCAGGLCVALEGDAKACLLPCPDPGGGCAVGQSCKQIEGVQLCVPDTGSCTCSAETAGASQPCAKGGSSIGACAGTRICDPSKGGWSDCNAVGASAEICNGVDDNCDGSTDNGLGTQPCGDTDALCPGVATCKGAAGWQCDAKPKQAESCNGLDDDCDGGTDEGLGAQPCGDTDALCPGAATCNGASGWLCEAKPKLTEVCNGVDDDCDGSTDEDLKSAPCGDNATLCPGQTTCKGAAGWLCSAAIKAPEACNGIDDDCDGITDEGFTNAAGKPQSLLHCGSCGSACPGPASLGTTVTCSVDEGGNPGCAWSCVAGWYDADALASTGCECKAQPGEDLPDGVDQDCDGVDGVAALAVFVAKTGSDQNPGSRALPMRTLNAALDRAVATGKPHLFVATGVYAETLTLIPGVSIYGGYASGFGVRDPIAFQTVIAGSSLKAGIQATVICDGISGGAAAVPTRVDGLTILGAAAQASGAPSYGVWSLGCDDRFILVGCQIIAGSGGAGASGNSGSGGGSGGKGSGGLAARDIGKDVCEPMDVQPGGKGAPSQCGSGDTSGGDGGAAICPVMDEDTPSPACPSKPYGQSAKAEETGKPGTTSIVPGAGAAGAGGKPGWDSYIDSWKGQVTACVNGPGCGTCRVPVEQRDGDDGNDGSAGSHGSGGSGCSATTGIATATAWIPSVGSDGSSGGNGGGGGGGGAAGGVEVHDCASSTSKNTDTGGSGGGGGAGGCGGSGGKGGGGGGASVAVGIVVGKGGAPVLVGNLLTGGNGGNGGSGGPGGGGGIGGKGGKGGAAVENKSETFCTSSGGDGGDGGDGGAGGGGGGGCGGPSAAVLLLPGAGTETTAVDTTALSALNQLVVGSPGSGGNGGPSIGGAGAKGQTGVATAILKP